jgi:hypothetical protein
MGNPGHRASMDLIRFDLSARMPRSPRSGPGAETHSPFQTGRRRRRVPVGKNAEEGAPFLQDPNRESSKI